jgi:hypothetical protein
MTTTRIPLPCAASVSIETGTTMPVVAQLDLRFGALRGYGKRPSTALEDLSRQLRTLADDVAEAAKEVEK